MGRHDRLKNTSERYQGASASYEVHKAQQIGEIPQTRPSSSSVSAILYSASAIDYNKPWFERRPDGEYYCNLCGAYATEGHIGSNKHQSRSEAPEWYGFGDYVAQVVASGGAPAVSREEIMLTGRYDKPWFELRDGFPHCLLCNKAADESHLGSERHVKRESAPEYYGFGAPKAIQAATLPPEWEAHWSEQHREYYYHNTTTGEVTWDSPAGTATAAASSSCTAIVPAPYPELDYNKPWFELKSDHQWYCNLCNNYATDAHILSTKHQKREAWSESYGYASSTSAPACLPCNPQAGRQTATTLGGRAAVNQAADVQNTQAPDDLPKPWEKHFDEEHKTFYYWNPETESSQWEKPSRLALTNS